jgi:histone H3/H4
VWFVSAVDPSIPADSGPTAPPPLDWQPQQPRRSNGVDFPCEIEVDRRVGDEIRRANVAVARGDATVAELDSHRNLNRLKIAALLGLLDNRVTVTAEDWSLAGLAVDTSDAVRATITEHAARAASQKERSRIEKQVSSARAIDSDDQARALARVATSIANHVGRRTCEGGHRRRCLTQAIAGRDRAVVSIDDAIDEAIRRGFIAADGDAYVPGEAEP